MENYNKKAFLLPNSANSCASFHAKTEDNNYLYKLTISDCNRSIRLHGYLRDNEQIDEAIAKLEALEKGIKGLKLHIKSLRK
jgi:hypothetical protein